ncbi:NAD(P)/FAD-dependent oxidoreductase [Sphingobium sp. H33]|uniref:NAD(P)/FAD-dependent oxidoreductase n=2 Tax=Sphingobium nicotianae TaxID=2782607 RepID=A0A9X1ITB2_9SPHN|nr:NAD(P)/FAD-dependent oxidoreductase [Sphingobium nicotianae]
MEATVRPVRPELLSASDEMIEDAVGYADPMALRGLLYLLTGDTELKTMELRKFRVGRVETVAPASDEVIAMLRRKAVDFLKAYRDAGAGEIDYDRARVVESLDLVVGERIMDAARDLMVEETALDPLVRSLKWQAEPDPERLDNFSVTIIGSGMGGLNAAIQLGRAGINYQIIEKNDEVGGTWYENHYPGARVDTPSRGYTNLTAVNYPYPRQFGTNKECQAVFERTADDFDLRKDISFNTEVRSLTWDEAAGLWDIRVVGPDGERTIRSNAVISGVGFLSRPSIPDIAGMDQFEGQSWHTARWPDGIDLRGKRVAVIGTGCTGYQMIPVLAQVEGIELTVFQRTAQWLIPIPGYLSESPRQLMWLDRNLPYHANFLRFKTIYGSGPDFVKQFDIEPGFDDPYSVSEAGKAARERAIEFLKSKISDPDLLAAMTPPHPMWSARPVVCDPTYSVLDAIQEENVTLVPQGIRSANRNGLVAADGSQHDVDVIIFATGFRAHDFLWPMEVTGKDGMTLDKLWAQDGARAYLGCMIPGFPNLWTLYGPNTNGGIGVPQYEEMTTLYLMQCMEKLILEGKKAIEVKEDAYWRYNRIVDEGNARKVWADPRSHSYWWSRFGRSVSQTPFTGYEIREHLLRPDFGDMDVR